MKNVRHQIAKDRKEEGKCILFGLVSFKRQDFLERIKKASEKAWICLLRASGKKGKRLFCYKHIVLCYVSHI